MATPPARPISLVNELRRHGFSDTEIVAADLASTSRTGQLVDRFRHRMMVGVRNHLDPRHPVVGFVGQAPPGATADVAPLLHSPAPVYRPGAAVFGLAEQAQHHPSSVSPVVATDALSAIAPEESDNVTAVAPCTPALTARQAATLPRVIWTAGEPAGISARTPSTGRAELSGTTARTGPDPVPTRRRSPVDDSV